MHIQLSNYFDNILKKFDYDFQKKYLVDKVVFSLMTEKWKNVVDNVENVWRSLYLVI